MTTLTTEQVRWTPVALATPEPARFWVCDSFYDKTFYDVSGTITHRSPAGTVRVSLDGFGPVGAFPARNVPATKQDALALAQADCEPTNLVFAEFDADEYIVTASPAAL